MNMHEFGGNGFDEPQIGLPGNRYLERVMQESGLVMNLDLFGNEQVEEQNKATKRAYGFDVETWKHNYGTYVQNRDYQIRQNQESRTFAELSTQWKEKSATDSWEHRKALQDYEHGSNVKQYNLSIANYKKQLGFNNLGASAAYESQMRNYDETQAEQSFQRQQQSLDALIAEGDARARGMVGRSATKLAQAATAEYGRNIAILDESMQSATLQHKANMQKIAVDKFGADLAAEAKKLLEPTRKPDIPEPRDLPRQKILDPPLRVRGPRPVRGARATGPGLLAKVSAVANVVLPFI